MDANKFSLVTGSSSGLGFNICEFLLDEGYVVFGVSRSGSDIGHPNYIDVICDLKLEDDVIDLFDNISEITNNLDVIVNAAGFFDLNEIGDVETENFLNHFETNVLGPFFIFKYVRDFIVEDITHFIQISSMAANEGFVGGSAYSASKFALSGLIESIEKEWKSLGVRFSTLLPSSIDTPMWDNVNQKMQIRKNEMLGMNDFMHVFEMVVNSSSNMSFPKIIFTHKSL